MTVESFLFVGNSNLLALRGLRNPFTNSFVSDAEVAVILEDLSGEEVAGQSWPLVLAAVEGEEGSYSAVLSASLNITPRKRYKLTWAAQGQGLTASAAVYLLAIERG